MVFTRTTGWSWVFSTDYLHYQVITFECKLFENKQKFSSSILSYFLIVPIDLQTMSTKYFSDTVVLYTLLPKQRIECHTRLKIGRKSFQPIIHTAISSFFEIIEYNEKDIFAFFLSGFLRHNQRFLRFISQFYTVILFTLPPKQRIASW